MKAPCSGALVPDPAAAALARMVRRGAQDVSNESDTGANIGFPQ